MLSPQILIAIDCILESRYSTKRVKQAQDYEQAQVKFKRFFSTMGSNFYLNMAMYKPTI